MPRHTGFLEYAREVPARRPVPERVNDWFEIYQPFAESKVRTQATRCMDCGIPFCHDGCPVDNLIPDWNELVHAGRWREALRLLHATNNFPEFTGRICPAPCEAACVLGISDPPVSIKLIEKSIVDRGFEEGWIHPEPARVRTGKRVAIIGSGPAGLAAAQQLCRAGHSVAVFEKHDRLGGLLRYGIPHFKMEKHLIDRRLKQLAAEGVEFVTGRHIGVDVPFETFRRDFDAILIAIGAEAPRRLNVPGADLKGIHYAMDYLVQQDRVNEGDHIPDQILATGKRVAIIGGGDTGADCLGTAHRQGAVSIHQLEYKDAPPPERHPSTPWPMWPIQLRVESSHEEGGYREWAAMTLGFSGDENGRVTHLHGIRVGPKPEQHHIPGTEFTLPVELVLVAAGFQGPTYGEVPTAPERGVYVAGDARRGQSLVVWAIAEGRKAAAEIHAFFS